jgi:hypothetical protein
MKNLLEGLRNSSLIQQVTNMPPENEMPFAEDYEDDSTFINDQVDINVKYNLYVVVPIVWSIIILLGVIGMVLNLRCKMKYP